MEILTDRHFLLLLFLVLGYIIFRVFQIRMQRIEKHYPFFWGIFECNQNIFALTSFNGSKKYKTILNDILRKRESSFFSKLKNTFKNGKPFLQEIIFPGGEQRIFRFYPMNAASEKMRLLFLSYPEEKKTAGGFVEVLDQFPFAISIKDPENGYKYLSVNQKFARICGLDREKIIGKDDFSLNPAAGPRSLAQDTSSIQTGALLDILEEVEFSQKRKQFFRVLKKTVKMENGHDLLLSVFCNKNADHEMQERHESLVSRMNEQLQISGLIHEQTIRLLLESDFQKSALLFGDFLQKFLCGEDVLIYERSGDVPKQYQCIFQLSGTSRIGQSADFSQWPKPGNQQNELDFLFTPESEGNDPRYSSAKGLSSGEECFSVSFSEEKFPPALLFTVVFEKKREPFSFRELYFLRSFLPIYRTLLSRSGHEIPDVPAAFPVLAQDETEVQTEEEPVSADPESL